MLIIAIPKSASSSLVTTLGDAHRLPVETARIRDDILQRRPVVSGFVQIARFHRRDPVDIDARVASAVSGSDAFAKFHFPPTPNNQAQLAATKKVVLLRDASSIVAAYRRGEETGAYRTRNLDFCFCLTEAGWLARARRVGFLDELERFADGWRAHAGEKLVIEYRDLVADPAGTLARVEDYWGLPRSGRTELRREKFSRNAAAPRRSAAGILIARRTLMLRRLGRDVGRALFGSETPLVVRLERRH